MISNELEFRRAVFSAIVGLKDATTAQRFSRFIDHLKNTVPDIPTNKQEEAKKFFFEAAKWIFLQLEPFYEVAATQEQDGEIFYDKFVFTLNENLQSIMQTYKTYLKSERFINAYLRYHDYDSFKVLNSFRHYLQFPSFLTSTDLKEGQRVVEVNKMRSDQNVYLPNSTHSDSIINSTSGYTYLRHFNHSTDKEIDNLKTFLNNSENLETHFKKYNQLTQESVRREHLQFGIAYLKEVLSRLIIPVSLLKDESLKKACEIAEREIFVKEPTIEDFLFIGASLQIHSSHNLNDDSSYIAKPILISDQNPSDTQDLKYLGIGQYTKYDNESVRSLNGENPYVINDTIYVKARLEDFMVVLPKELIDEIEACKQLASPNSSLLYKTEETDSVKEIIKSIKTSSDFNPSYFIENVLKKTALLNNENHIQNSNVSTNEDTFTEATIFVNHTIFSNAANKSFEYAIFLQEDQSYIVVKKHGLKIYYCSTKPHASCDEAIKLLSLPDGIYPIFDFGRRERDRSEAIIKLHPYKGE